jgi:hypothetical protein
MPDRGTVPGIPGHLVLDLAGEVYREHGQDSGIRRDDILSMSWSVAQRAFVVPGLLGAGGIYRDKDSQVGESFFVDCLGDLRFPGHAPEPGGVAGLCQTDKVGDMGREKITRARQADRGMGLGLIDQSGDGMSGKIF